MGIKMSPKIPRWYVRYEEAKVDRSAILHDFRDNEKKQLRAADWRPFWILLVQKQISWVIIV